MNPARCPSLVRHLCWCGVLMGCVTLGPRCANADEGYVAPIDWPFDQLMLTQFIDGASGYGDVLEPAPLEPDFSLEPQLPWDFRANHTFRHYRPHYGSASHGHASCSYYHSTSNPNWPYSSSWGTACHPTRYYFLESSLTGRSGWAEAAVEAFKNWDIPDACTPHWVRTTDAAKAHVKIRVASSSSCSGPGTSWYACAWSGWSITLNSAIGFGLGVSGKVDVESVITVELAHVVHFAHSPNFADSISQANMGIWGASTVRVPSSNSCGFTAYTACLPTGSCTYKDCPPASEGGCGSARRLRPGDSALAKHIAGTNTSPSHPYDDGSAPPPCEAVLSGAETIIDDLAPGCFERLTSYWWDVAEGYDGHHYTTFASDKAAPETIGRYHFTVATPGSYRLEAWMPATEVGAKKVRYTVHGGAAAVTSAPLDQTAQQGWVELGVFALQGPEGYVQIDDNTGESLTLARKIAFDALRWTWLEPAPECATVGAEGTCFERVLGRCADGVTYETTDCGAPSLCLWDEVAGAARCASCGDVQTPRCDGAVWVRCDAGAVLVEDCAAAGQGCTLAGCMTAVADGLADVSGVADTIDSVGDTTGDGASDAPVVLSDVPSPDRDDQGELGGDAGARGQVGSACACALTARPKARWPLVLWWLVVGGAVFVRRRRTR